MYWPFNFSYSQNPHQQQRVHHPSDSTNTRKFHSMPINFASVSSGFSTSSFLPEKERTLIMNSKSSPYENYQVFGGQYQQNFRLNTEKEFFDYSNMPMSTSQSHLQTLSTPKSHIKEKHYSRNHYTPNCSLPIYHPGTTQTSSFDNSREFSRAPSVLLNPKQLVNTIFESCQRMTSTYMERTMNQNHDHSVNHPRWHYKKVQSKKGPKNFTCRKPPQEKTPQKNYHEKSRSSLEKNMHEDCCESATNTSNSHGNKGCSTNEAVTEESKRASDNPPFLIYSEIEFPAIKNTVRQPPRSKRKRKDRSGKCHSRSPSQKNNNEFVVIASEAPMLTPTFEPPKMSLCDRIINSPKKLLPQSCSVSIKPILKLSKARRSFSESSDDWIQFATEESPESLGEQEEEYETESTSEDSESEDEDDYEKSCLDHYDVGEEENKRVYQTDSGFEEKRVSSKIEIFVGKLPYPFIVFFRYGLL